MKCRCVGAQKCKKKSRNSFPLLCNDVFCRNLRPKNVEIMHNAVILWTCPKGHFKFWHGSASGTTLTITDGTNTWTFGANS